MASLSKYIWMLWIPRIQYQPGIQAHQQPGTSDKSPTKIRINLSEKKEAKRMCSKKVLQLLELVAGHSSGTKASVSDGKKDLL